MSCWPICTLIRARLVAAAALLACAAALAQPQAQAIGGDALAPYPAAVQQALTLARAAAVAAAPAGAQVEVVAGRADPRLRLAPCSQVQALAAPGAPAWGRTRVALRCVAGGPPWSAQLPLTVSVLAPALVLRAAVPAGQPLRGDQLERVVADWAAHTSPLFNELASLEGRIATRGLAAGQPVAAADVLARRWFAAGDVVDVLASGNGFAVTLQGQALNHGIEGQPARVRTESGRVLTGLPVAARRLELAL